MESPEQHYRRQHKVIIAPAPKWAQALYRFNHWSKGDTIFLSAMIAMVTEDRQMLLNLVELLRQRRRWPKELDYPNDAPNMFIQILDELISHYNRRASRTEWMPIIPWKKRFRWVGGMTRDPFTMVIIAWDHLMEGPCPVRVPILQQRLGFLFWVRYMKTKREWQKKIWEFSARNPGKKPMYVYHLNCWRAWAAKSEKVKKLLEPVIPEWNFLCRLLVDHHLNYLSVDRMRAYKSKNGYAWDDRRLFIPPEDSRVYLDPGDEYQPDKQILNFIMKWNHLKIDEPDFSSGLRSDLLP